ncbi:MAG: hypothetical protein E8D41_13155 [Nitrospira sp.]|nr:MAG: hypothetical protein E8D41_13155 [Nitrospira sp.]
MPFSISLYRRSYSIALFVVCLLSLSSVVSADSLWNGAWVLRVPPQEGRLIMTVEEVDTGWTLTYQVVGPDAPASTVSTVQTPLNGKEVPLLVNGKPSGQTMGIKRIDTYRTVTILKFKGKETGVSKAEVSPDGKVLKIEIDYVSSNPIGKEIQYWDRQ